MHENAPKKCPFRAFQPCAEHGCKLFVPHSTQSDDGWCAITTLAIVSKEFVDEYDKYGLNVNVTISE